MYKLIKVDGTELGVTETVLYIKKNAHHDCYVPTDKASAVGVAFDGVPYNLLGYEEIPDADTVLVCETDSNAVFVQIDEMAAAIQAGVNEI